MGRKDPEAVSVFSELVDLDSSVHVPETEGFVFRVGEEYLHARVENAARDVV